MNDLSEIEGSLIMLQKTVLIVDDSPSMRQMIEFTISNMGFNVVQGVDGVDALEKLEKSNPDLFLVDINMPRMDGITFIKEVRKKRKYSHTPIVVLTTESQPERKIQGKEAGATGWIVKPFNPLKLVKIINKVLPQ